MCKERRVAVGKADMSGDQPKTAWSLTFGNIKVILFLIVIIGAIFGAANWMSTEAQFHFDHRLASELLPPEGSVYNAIHSHMVEVETIQEEIDLMKRQDVRSNQMLERVFTVATGEKPPPRITE